MKVKVKASLAHTSKYKCIPIHNTYKYKTKQNKIKIKIGTPMPIANYKSSGETTLAIPVASGISRVECRIPSRLSLCHNIVFWFTYNFIQDVRCKLMSYVISVYTRIIYIIYIDIMTLSLLVSMHIIVIYMYMITTKNKSSNLWWVYHQAAKPDARKAQSRENVQSLSHHVYE